MMGSEIDKNEMDLKKFKLDKKKLKLDAYKIRIEDFDRNYFSLRGIEWWLALQFLGGYIAIAVAHFKLQESNHNSLLLALGGVVFPTFLFWIYWGLRLRVQERLQFTRDNKNLYLDKIHSLVCVPRLVSDNTPKHHTWYAYKAQMRVNAAIALSVIVYVVAVTPWRELVLITPWGQVGPFGG